LLDVDSTRHEGEQRGVYRTVEVEVEKCLEREEEDLCNECGGNIRYDKRKEKIKQQNPLPESSSTILVVREEEEEGVGAGCSLPISAWPGVQAN
jgi:hypothetical protein